VFLGFTGEWPPRPRPRAKGSGRLARPHGPAVSFRNTMLSRRWNYHVRSAPTPLFALKVVSSTLGSTTQLTVVTTWGEGRSDDRSHTAWIVQGGLSDG
jgi:hypothetical protein